MKLMKEASEEKLRGAFYTPEPIAKFILKWAMIDHTEKLDILEPSCGDGVFLKALQKGKYDYNSVTAIEFEPVESKKSQNLNLDKTNVLNMDFHQFCLETNQRFDLIIGNPPYIRYQYFDKRQQELAAQIFAKVDMKYSKLTNAWVSFVVGSSILLKSTGKIAFVLPAEILQVSYAQPLREFLAHYFNKINIVSFEKLVFPDIQQEVILLLCEKNQSENHFIEHIELKDSSGLETLNISKLNNPKKRIDFKSNKWTFYFLEQEEIDFLEKLQKEKIIPQFSEYAKVEVGITTGSNPFFTVPLSTVKEYNLEEYAKPLVGRSVQVPSIIFTEQDWIKNRDSEARTHFLSFPKRDVLEKIYETKSAEDYIVVGEQQKIHTGYKCGIRDEWQIVPSQRISEALFIRRNNIYPKLIINKAKAFTTDTMHRVSVKETTDLKALTASYYNSLSFAFAEICGRSHGGGVLELMPNEVERILIPYHTKNAELLSHIDKMVRSKVDISTILSYTNEKILKEQFNLTDNEINLADKIWKKLVNRRLRRGKKGTLPYNPI